MLFFHSIIGRGFRIVLILVAFVGLSAFFHSKESQRERLEWLLQQGLYPPFSGKQHHVGLDRLSRDDQDRSVISKILLYDNPDTWRDYFFDSENPTATFFQASTTKMEGPNWIHDMSILRFHLQFALKGDVPVYRLIKEGTGGIFSEWLESRQPPDPNPTVARISYLSGDGTIWEFQARFPDLSEDDEDLHFYYSEWAFCEPCLTGNGAGPEQLAELARELRYYAQEASPDNLKAAMLEHGITEVVMADAAGAGAGMDEGVVYGEEAALAARDAFIAGRGSRPAPAAATTAAMPAARSGDAAAALVVTEGQQCFDSAEIAEAVMWEQAMQRAKAICEGGGGFLDFASLKPASIQTN